jgi:peroxiredoxin
VIERLTGQPVDSGAETPDTDGNARQTSIESGMISGSETAIDRPGTSVTSPLESIEEAAQAVGGLEVGTDVGNLAPTFEATTDTGETLALGRLRGQVVLLNFWATWCGPCRLEMPEFQKTYEALAGDGLTIVAVNNRETVEDVTGFREEYDLTFPLVMDEQGDIQDIYGVMMYPSTYVIGRDGRIIARHFGALTVAQLQVLVSRAMG